MQDTKDRVVRPLESAWPISDAAFVATLVTGVPPWVHRVAADAIHDAMLATTRPPHRVDLHNYPVWDIVHRQNFPTTVVGTSLSSSEPIHQTAAASSVLTRDGDQTQWLKSEAQLPSSDTVQSIVGARVDDASRGPPGPSRRHAVEVIDRVAELLATHATAIQTLKQTPMKNTGALSVLCYHTAGELFRSPLVHRGTLSATIARFVAEIESCLPHPTRLLVCSLPTASTAQCLSTTAAAGHVARGICLITRPPSDVPPVVSLTDVTPSIIAIFGGPLSLEFTYQDPLGFAEASDRSTVLTHTPDGTPNRNEEHPELPSLHRIAASAPIPPEQKSGHGHVLCGANDAAMAAFAAASGNLRAARVAAARLGNEHAFPAVDALRAFDAARNGDHAVLAALIHRLRRDSGETPLVEAGLALADTLAGDAASGRDRLDALRRASTESSHQLHPRLILPLVGQTAEIAGLPDLAREAWTECIESAMDIRLGHEGLARLEGTARNWSECLCHIEAAITLGVDTAQAHELRAKAKAACGELRNAVADLEAVVQRGHADEHIMALLCDLLRQAGRPKDAASYAAQRHDQRGAWLSDKHSRQSP